MGHHSQFIVEHLNAMTILAREHYADAEAGGNVSANL